MMMSFCKRSIHSFLGTTTTSKDTVPPPRCRNIPSPIDGLSIVVKPPCRDSSSSPVITTGVVRLEKKDSGVIGFIDEIGGGVDGLMSCTESLGFESSDERRTDQHLLDLLGMTEEERERDLCSTTSSKRKLKVRSEPRSFPPPISSLKENGQPNFYLRSVRKDGRLELTEVRIDRTEVLHASRRDGRLRLHLLRPALIDQTIDDEAEENQLPAAVANGGGGDGFRRCFEVVNHHTNNVWNQQQHCVTTR